MRKSVLLILITLTCCVLVSQLAVRAQPKSSLTEAERIIVNGSRQAVVHTGISEAYFDRHYKLVKVVNQSSDRRVIWRLTINGYSTIVSDTLGFYTQNGKRVDTHSVGGTLGRTSEIEHTIPRGKALRTMWQCIGNFRNVTVEYRPGGDAPAQLTLNAEAIRRARPRSSKAEREREEREARERSKNSKGVDEIEQEGDDDGPPIVVGSVDLVSGKCIRGQLLHTR